MQNMVAAATYGTSYHFSFFGWFNACAQQRKRGFLLNACSTQNGFRWWVFSFVFTLLGGSYLPRLPPKTFFNESMFSISSYLSQFNEDTGVINPISCLLSTSGQARFELRRARCTTKYCSRKTILLRTRVQSRRLCKVSEVISAIRRCSNAFGFQLVNLT